MGPEPVWNDAVLLSVEDRKAAKLEEEEEGILEAMREYTGPMNRRGTYPKGPFMGLRGKVKAGSCGTDAMTCKVADNHDRPTTHQHHPDTCRWLGCKATDEKVEAILAHSVEVTRKVREQDRKAQRRLVPDFHMEDY